MPEIDKKIIKDRLTDDLLVVRMELVSIITKIDKILDEIDRTLK